MLRCLRSASHPSCNKPELMAAQHTGQRLLLPPSGLGLVRNRVRKRDEIMQWAESKVIKGFAHLVNALSDSEGQPTSQEALTANFKRPHMRRRSAGDMDSDGGGNGGVKMSNQRFKWSRGVVNRTLGALSTTTGPRVRILILILACINELLDRIYVLLTWSNPPHSQNFTTAAIWTFICLCPSLAFQFLPPIAIFVLVVTTETTQKKLESEESRLLKVGRRPSNGERFGGEGEFSESELSEVPEAAAPVSPWNPPRIRISQHLGGGGTPAASPTTPTGLGKFSLLPRGASTPGLTRQVARLLQRTLRIVEFLHQQRLMVHFSKVNNALAATVAVIMWIVISASLPTFLVVYCCGMTPLFFFSPWVVRYREYLIQRWGQERER